MCKILFGVMFFGVILLSLSHAGAKTLTWGADSVGGAPYVFQDPAHPRRIIGFEVDIVRDLARIMHRRDRFVQNAWDALIPALDRGDFSIAINGIEITPQRARVVNFSIPYYACSETLMVRRTNDTITGLASLRGRVVGTLQDSLAEKILRRYGGIHVRAYTGQITAYQDLLNGRLDAVLMDAPIADYYGKPLAGLKVAGPPIGHMLYGIAMRKTDARLLARINQALRQLINNGSLEHIYKKWNIWNARTRKLFAAMRQPKPGELQQFTQMVTAHRTWRQQAMGYLRDTGILIRDGLPMTILLSILSMSLAIVIGLILAICRIYTPWPTAILARAYIEVFRGTPLLIQLYLIFFGLPSVGIRLSPLIAGILGLGLNYGAYEAENFRAGILSIPHAQMEAALSLGLSRAQGVRHIIIPQALRTCLPPVTNDFISLIKDSSIVSVISMVELTKVYGELAATYYNYIGLGLITAAIYFLIGLPFVQLSRWLERKLPGAHHLAVAGGKPLQ